MKKNFVSNSEESPRMFRSGILEFLSKVHFSVPLILYLPIIFYLSYKSLHEGLNISSYFIYFIAGVLVWTATEYLLHRFIFHFVPKSKIGLRLHFIFHGVHHDYPRDRMRLVMPPSASIILAVFFYFLFSLVVKAPGLYSFYSGFLIGYLIYDMSHYAIHHYNFKNPLFVKIKEHHMMHHYYDSTKGFGVSSSLWDIILDSNFKGITRNQNVQQQ